MSTRAGERLSRWKAARGLSCALPAAALAALAGATFLWRVLAWQPAATVDAWAYGAWGQALARGERPLFELGATTPKPLAALLGTVVAPLPPERALAVVVALALGALAASLFAAAYREGGAVAAVVAVVALAVGARLDAAVAFAYIDGVVAALVLAGVALRGRLRIGALVLAGLLRPEAWLVAGVAGFSETAGSLRRRAGAALAAGVAAPALWMLGDLVLMSDPLGTLHWHSARLGARRDPTDVSWADVGAEYWAALTTEGGAALALAGMLGLGLHYFKARRRGVADLVPIAVVVVWSLLPALQFRYGANLNARYLLPLVAILALGCGLLAVALVPSRLRVRSPWPAVVVAAGVLGLVVVSMDLRPGMLREMGRNDAIMATRPAVESVLSCGRLGTTRRTAVRGVIPQLAASSRRSLYEFGIYRSGGRFAGVLHFAPRRRPADP
ncbi:MAG: hypothetical protein ACRDNE_17805, partial [Gaiellaceae bacterium]